MTETSTANFPFLSEMLSLQGRPLQAVYTTADVATIFNVSTRTIQSRAADGSLPSRKLIGRGRFMSCDLESFLSNSKKFSSDALRTSSSIGVISNDRSRHRANC